MNEEKNSEKRQSELVCFFLALSSNSVRSQLQIRDVYMYNIKCKRCCTSRIFGNVISEYLISGTYTIHNNHLFTYAECRVVFVFLDDLVG